MNTPQGYVAKKKSGKGFRYYVVVSFGQVQNVAVHRLSKEGMDQGRVVRKV